MNILYFNNCWFENIGEAFIDFGARELLQKIFYQDSIIHFSHMNYMFLNWNHASHEEMKKCYNMSENLVGEYAVLAGMFATEGFCDKEWISYQMFKSLSDRGVKLIFLGIGGENYSNSEIEKFKRILEDLKPVLVTTRDLIAYENYNSICSCLNSIDCAFWVKDMYNPQMNCENMDYDIVAYNRSKEPDIFDDASWERKIVRPFHFPYSFNKSKIKNNFFMSDSPYDYLTLYANANNVYTDMIHITVPALQYGVPVQFKGVDKRENLFCSVKAIYEEDGFWKCDDKILQLQKEEIEKEMSKKLRIYPDL